jgi:hypothetical protein
MHKQLILTIVFVLVSVVLVFPQDLMVKPYGISPAEVKRDTVGNPDYLGIKDIRYSGLRNVGVGTKVYLVGVYEDSFLTALSWNMFSQPSESEATLAAPVEVDSASEVTSFIADLEGEYQVAVSEGAETDTVVIHASTYVGDVEDNCSLCHSEIVTPWSETGHALMLTNALEGLGRSGTTCLPCHTTGWDTSATAANDGFDDFDFMYPDTQFVGMADSMYTEYPDAMARANIQCEACHGPITMSGHTDEETNTMEVTLEPDNCAYCHDDDHYHVYPSQWIVSGHADPPSYPAGGRDDCRGCHNGWQFIQWVEGGDDAVTAQPDAPIACAVCHDPHDASKSPENQLRTVEATLSNGEVVTEGGNGRLCMNCHQSRRDAATYPLEPHSHFGPHYVPQADMILGTNAVDFGYDLPSSPHVNATDDGCVDCHMWEAEGHGEFDEDHKLNTFGMHSFSMVNVDGEENVTACEGAGCHGPIGESFSDKKYYVNGSADHDGDGVEEGLQDEVHGLIDTLASLLPAAEGHDAYDPHDDVDSTWTVTELQAAYNLEMAYYDHSFGIHNPAFTVALLQVSIAEVKGLALSIGPDGALTPLSYELSQNFPNPFNPSTQINFSLKTAGKVELKVFDILGREVATLVNDHKAAGAHTVEFNASGLASGIYFYRIVADQFTAMKKMMLLK